MHVAVSTCMFTCQHICSHVLTYAHDMHVFMRTCMLQMSTCKKWNKHCHVTYMLEGATCTLHVPDYRQFIRALKNSNTTGSPLCPLVKHARALHATLWCTLLAQTTPTPSLHSPEKSSVRLVHHQNLIVHPHLPGSAHIHAYPCAVRHQLRILMNTAASTVDLTLNPKPQARLPGRRIQVPSLLQHATQPCVLRGGH